MKRVSKFLAIAGALALCCRTTIGDEILQEMATGVLRESLPSATMEIEENLVPDSDAATIVLRENGELAGRFRVVWPTGKIEPADAFVTLLKGDQLVGEVETDEKGMFEMTGLEPGEYIARATIAEGSKDFEIAIVEHRDDAKVSEMFLDATLTPLPDMVDGAILADSCGGCGVCDECLATEVIEEPIEECMPMADCMMGAPCGSSCGGFGGGGCCGGGMGWWPLLGLAGLAGLAGLVDDDDKKTVVSPYQVNHGKSYYYNW